MQVHMTNTRNTPVEALEIAYPLRVSHYRLRRGSGGAGRRPGGDGIERGLVFLAPAHLTLVSDRRVSRPWGVAGGAPGARGECWLLRHGQPQRLAPKTSLAVAAGDELVLATPGGGGWGPAA